MDEKEFYRKTQQYRDQIETLIKAGAFAIRNGSVKLHFDSEGNIMLIGREDAIYKRSKNVVPS